MRQIIVGIIIIFITIVLLLVALFGKRKRVVKLASIGMSAISILETAFTLVIPNSGTFYIFNNQTFSDNYNSFVAFDFSNNNIHYDSTILHGKGDDYSVIVSVRDIDDDTFMPSVFAVKEDVVEYQIEYINYYAPVDNVMVRFILPENAEYIEHSTKLYNSNHIEGIVNDDDTIITDGINIGDYDYGANAYIRFRAIIKDVSLAEGTNLLYGWGQVGIGEITKQDAATIVVTK